MEFLNPISQSDFVGVQAMYLALLLASRVTRALDGPEGGAASRCRISFGLRDLHGERCRIRFGLRGLPGICIPSPQKYVKLFFLEKFLKTFYIFM